MTTLATPRTTSTATGRRPLWFAADAVVTGVNAAAYLALAGPLADLLGGDPTAYRAIGAFMVGYALVVGLYARSTMSRRTGWAIVVGNLVWVLASLEVAATGVLGLDTAGRIWVVAQALVVADLALLQGRSLRAR
ncbi:hypothetical protein ASE01_15140 [Nocardioides sp. Root190]|uniref:hypothetical protein n=1 Tax=Nocardioides sp. Root190 TaxID=1736488 RepID=UPI0006FDEFD8|nr:hypothetical protein [Nocardioides sp. Root190]KRB76332.1 hypothetical protein ASE01_15140 [Nocardioides sp. Root190]